MVGALGEDVSVLDGMCASGARGIRYAKENKNVKALTLTDIDSKAVRLARANVKLNKLTNALVAKAEFNSFVFKNSFDLVELDPFGSPAPFLYHAVRSFRCAKSGFLSLTATDAAVLCGAHPDACWKNYFSRPLNNEYTHETACRILIGFVSRYAASFNFGITPLVTLSKRHYFKVVVKLSLGADNAVESVKANGFLAHCPACFWREVSSTPRLPSVCPSCGKRLEWAGPLWLGSLHDQKTLDEMNKLNTKRSYKNKEALAATLDKMIHENPLPPTFYDVHELFGKYRKPLPKMGEIFKRLERAGAGVSQTHFSPIGLKTSLNSADFLEVLKKSF